MRALTFSASFENPGFLNQGGDPDRADDQGIKQTEPPKNMSTEQRGLT